MNISMRGRLFVIALVLSSSVGCAGTLGPWFSESGDATSAVFVADSETNGSGVPVTSVVEQANFEDAVVTLQRMSDFIASQESLGFEAEITYDAIQASGEKIEFGSHRKVAFRRSDGVRFETTHWDGTREILTFDGARLSGVIPSRGVYATRLFSGDVGEALDYLSSDYEVAVPLEDLLRPNLPSEVVSRLRTGRRLDSVTIGGGSL